MTRAELYDHLAVRCADLVVREYSTSFGLATRTLPRRQRAHIRNIYALVRLADEVVDGAAPAAPGEQATCLRRLEEETAWAVATGYSTNPLVHAFARTARRTGIGAELTDPFFASMRMDLERTSHDRTSFDAYVHGSAEVVGLMCLRVLLADLDEQRRERCYEVLAPGARGLGAAFQKINFLRDLGEDAARLGRSYFPGIDPWHLSDDDKAAILAEIDTDLRVAAAAIGVLPPAGARAVRVVHALFSELADRLRATPAADLARSRVRVPNLVKARIAAVSLVAPATR